MRRRKQCCAACCRGIQRVFLRTCARANKTRQQTSGERRRKEGERRREEGERRREEGGRKRRREPCIRPQLPMPMPHKEEEEAAAQAQLYLLYWYKSTNTDACGAGTGGGYEQYSTNPTGSAPTRKTPQLKRVSLGGNLLVEVVHRERGTGRVVVLGQARVTLEGLLGLKSSKSCEERWLPLTDSNGNVLRGNEVTGGDGWLAQAALRQLPPPAGGGRGAHAGVASVVSDSTSFKLHVCLIDITHNS
jgi:hypothetical protein